MADRTTRAVRRGFESERKTAIARRIEEVGCLAAALAKMEEEFSGSASSCAHLLLFLGGGKDGLQKVGVEGLRIVRILRLRPGTPHPVEGLNELFDQKKRMGTIGRQGWEV